ncbi:hypothetical protein BZL30_0684 [Mycobacterium kansasii]|uniref:Uncharacterized protein n=1 Tax=Mycobacterium kansasii TaxID=1768 RepID=A0A1V3XTQ1_MYCKA|nr:hypothetical protein BZL30_0684 [Mycobacterium kansasii]
MGRNDLRDDRLLLTQLDTIAAGSITASADLLCPTGKELVDKSSDWPNEADQALNRRGRQTGYPATPALPASPTRCQPPAWLANCSAAVDIRLFHDPAILGGNSAQHGTYHLEGLFRFR